MPTDQHFLSAPGEMSALIRAHDWASTPLGPPEMWPQGLKTTLRLALTTSHPMFVFWGEEHLCFYNDAYRASLGPEKHPAILGMHGREAWPEIWEIIGPQIDLVMRGEGSTWHENHLVPIVRHGELQQVYWTYSYGPIDDPTTATGIGGVLVVCTETTAQVLAEQQRFAEGERLRALFEQAPGFMCVLRGPEHTFELANAAYQRLVGQRELVGKRARDAFPDVADQGYLELLDRVYASGEPYVGREQSVWLQRVPDEPPEERFLDFVYQPIIDAAGAVTGIFVEGTDVTKRRRTEEELRAARDESERRRRLYETVTGSTPDLIYVFDLNYRFTYANDALLEMWGKTWEESIGKNLLEIGYEPWHAEMHEREIDQVVATKRPIRGEVSFPHATLGRRIYDYIFAPVLDDKGEVEAIAGTTRDITELRQLSQQKDEFIGIVSHELRTPVTSIKAYAQILQRRFRNAEDTKSAEMVARMESQLNRLASLIGDLLDVTKIEAGQLQFRNELFDVDALVDDVIDELQHTTDRHRIVREGRTGARIWGDRERTGQVLINLLTNAIKYSPRSDTVIVRSSSDEHEVTIGVQDFGVGIAEEDRKRVFERFYRVSGPDQEAFPGIGLGLYITAEIVRRQGGRIWVESARGKGSTFCFSLPIREPAPGMIEAGARLMQPNAGSPVRGRQP